MLLLIGCVSTHNHQVLYRVNPRNNQQTTYKKELCHVLESFPLLSIFPLRRNQWFKVAFAVVLPLDIAVASISDIIDFFCCFAVAALITRRIIFHSALTCHSYPSRSKSSKRSFLLPLIWSILYLLPLKEAPRPPPPPVYRTRTNPIITMKMLSFWPARWRSLI